MIEAIIKDVTYKIRNAKEELESTAMLGLDESKSVHSRDLLLQSLTLLNLCNQSINSSSIEVCIASVTNLINEVEQLCNDCSHSVFILNEKKDEDLKENEERVEELKVEKAQFLQLSETKSMDNKCDVKRYKYSSDQYSFDKKDAHTTHITATATATATDTDTDIDTYHSITDTSTAGILNISGTSTSTSPSSDARKKVNTKEKREGERVAVSRSIEAKIGLGVGAVNGNGGVRVGVGSTFDNKIIVSEKIGDEVEVKIEKKEAEVVQKEQEHNNSSIHLVEGHYNFDFITMESNHVTETNNMNTITNHSPPFINNATVDEETPITSAITTTTMTSTTTSAESASMNILTHEDVSNQTSVLFKDIVGNESAKQSLKENILLQFKLPTNVKEYLFQGLRRTSSNVLLYGPPGTGKTFLAKATAYESKATFFSVKPSEILSKYQGESERFIQSLFSKAYREPKAIIFFDEFDSITCARGQSEEGGAQSRALLAELLLQLSEHKERNKRRFDSVIGDDQTNRHQAPLEGQVVVIAATNRIDDVDEAIQRRFESKVFCGLPNANERYLLIQKFLTSISFELSGLSMNEIVAMTEGWSGSDIENLVRETVMIPMRRIMPTLLNFPEGMDIATEEWAAQMYISPVKFEDFLTARDTLLMPAEYLS